MSKKKERSDGGGRRRTRKARWEFIGIKGITQAIRTERDERGRTGIDRFAHSPSKPGGDTNNQGRAETGESVQRQENISGRVKGKKNETHKSRGETVKNNCFVGGAPRKTSGRRQRSRSDAERSTKGKKKKGIQRHW